MDTERSGLDEAMDVGSSTISHLKSLKTAATFSKAGYGAALGGPFSAAIGAVIANRNQFAKILLVILAILLLPVLFIVMLPGLIFGSLTEQSDVLNSNSMISENIRASRDAIVEVLEESHEDILAEIHAAISRLPQGDTASINDPYTYSISVNANLLISQFCASQDDYKNINRNQLKKLIRENKEGLFSYDVATETVTMLWSSIFVTLMANKIGGLQFGIYRNCQISSRVFHTAVAALPLTKANRSDFE
ncbi:hypothetical protein [Mediterraneibacter gnavus]|uniref:hypothetical protein n=1 Tax=Mediterraneibacter gnavus TaxID=33038 RepID=UPI001CD7E83F|nr:hypothetical protein [Mediterraneibacter gnavus]UBS46727.1 hypothetical protein LCQ72_04025 [Mediterraneibacter gnavus]